MHSTHTPQAVARNWRRVLTGLLLPLGLLSGCQNMNNTEAGVLGGGLIGGALGAVVGAATHHPLAGAAIGAGAGAAIGGVSGNAEDRREHKQQQAVTAAVQRGQMELEEVAKMARGGVADAIIIDHIRQSGSIFTLSADQILWLKDQGVSQTVIHEMETTGRRPVYVRPQPSVVYVEEPRPVVVVGGGYYRRGGW